MKVFGGNEFHDGKQVRAIVATTSQKKAAELLGVTLGCIRKYWAETGNSIELEVALSSPETVFVASGLMHKDFKPRVKDS